MDLDKVALGKVLKELREAKGMTREQVAEQIGKTVEAVGQYERGITFPHVKTLSKIVNALGVDANQLLSAEASTAGNVSHWIKNTTSNMTDRERKAFGTYLIELGRMMLEEQTSDDAPLDEINKDNVCTS